MSHDADDARDLQQRQWEQRTSTPLLAAALLFLVLLTIPVIDRELPPLAQVTLRVLDVLIWAAFVIDYIVRLRLAKLRRRFVLTHLPDLAMIALPALRPLRILRLLSLANTMARRSAGTALADTGRAVAASATLVVYLGAVGVLDSERDARGTNITSFGDALWWACTTITTVGYGDHYPVTTEGRLIAVVLMIVGVSLLGLLTAGIAAWFVRQSNDHAAAQIARGIEVAAEEEERNQRDISNELTDLLASVSQLQADIHRIAARAEAERKS